jgi:2-oxoglutarate/2-oxoacid ferredoxin oxidoreductase subunit beta
MPTPQDYSSPVHPTWCVGCGNYGIHTALKGALVGLGLAPHQVLLVSGIGCGSKLPDYTTANGFLTLHGRTLAVATGARLANHGLKVFCVHGDGDSYGEGGNHLLHAARRNIGLVDIVQNNRRYSLTKGQYSPTSDHGLLTSTSPEGAIEETFNPLAVALAAGATFVARGFAGDPKHLTELLIAAGRHRGYALVDVLQPCVSFNRENTYDWYRARVYKLETSGYSPADRVAAFAKCQEWGDKIPIGVIFRQEECPSYEEQVTELRAGPLVGRALPRTQQDWDSARDEMA